MEIAGEGGSRAVCSSSSYEGKRACMADVARHGCTHFTIAAATAAGGHGMKQAW